MLAQKPFLRWNGKYKKKFAKALCVWKVLGPFPLRTLILEGRIQYLRQDVKMVDWHKKASFGHSYEEGQTCNKFEKGGVTRSEYVEGTGEGGAVLQEGDFGYRRIIRSDGSYYQGYVNFQGLLEGQGKEFDAKTGITKEGIWKQGKLIKVKYLKNHTFTK